MGIFDFLKPFSKLKRLKVVLAQIGTNPIAQVGSSRLSSPAEAGLAHSARRGIAPFKFVGKKVATLVNYVLLTAVYFTAFAATAAIAKVARKRFLELKPDLGRKSYWIERKKEDYSSKESYRAF